jgi:hypothetical protein
LKSLDKSGLTKNYEKLFAENGRNCFNCLLFKMIPDQAYISQYAYPKIEAQCTCPFITDRRKRIINLESLYKAISYNIGKRNNCKYFEDTISEVIDE